MSKPLAYLARPKKLKDVFGHQNLIGDNGILTKMIEKQKPQSFIISGAPGIGKTTIANIFADSFKNQSFLFNASTDNKAKLSSILATTAYNDIILIIDEIHRMKSDIQDYLLPFIENGKVIFIGITTLNPYYHVNQAIRSRCLVFEMNKLDDEDIKKGILNALNMLDLDIKIDSNALKMMIDYANGEIRTAINLLESASLFLNDGQIITKNILKNVIGKKNLDLDANGDNYYQLLSALQKSIRDSDVDASIHYLARLLTLGDILSISRRLIVIAYEDISLANPNLSLRVYQGCQAALFVGMPEARIIFSNLVIELAISPKSNTAYLALNDALNDFQNNKISLIPDHLNNNKIKLDPSIYVYPHDLKGSISNLNHLPKNIINKSYYFPKAESNYEKALKERLIMIDKIKNKIRKK